MNQGNINSKYGAVIEPGTIRFERLLPGPAERIWSWLTDADKKSRWLAGGEVEPFVGGKVELFFLHRNLSNQADPIPDRHKTMENGTGFEGRVTRYDPPVLLSYTWEGEPTGEASEVTFELQPKGDKVLLILTHRQLGEDEDHLISVASGWHTHLGILSDRLSGDDPEGFWKVHGRVEKEYEQILKSTSK